MYSYTAKKDSTEMIKQGRLFWNIQWAQSIRRKILKGGKSFPAVGRVMATEVGWERWHQEDSTPTDLGGHVQALGRGRPLTG